MSTPRQPGGRRLLPTRSTPPRRRGRVLVVEDHPPAAEMVRDFLGDEGYEVVAAVGLTTAEGALAAGRFDLVLCDSLRKSTTGLLNDRWAALERVRALVGGAPVVLMVAYRRAPAPMGYLSRAQHRGGHTARPGESFACTTVATIRRRRPRARRSTRRY